MCLLSLNLRCALQLEAVDPNDDKLDYRIWEGFYFLLLRRRHHRLDIEIWNFNDGHKKVTRGLTSFPTHSFSHMREDKNRFHLSLMVNLKKHRSTLFRWPGSERCGANILHSLDLGT